MGEKEKKESEALGRLAHNCPYSPWTGGWFIVSQAPGWKEALWESSVLPKNTTVSPARVRTRIARSGDEAHEATAPHGAIRGRREISLLFPITLTAARFTYANDGNINFYVE